ncbi:Ig-like domain-containing protein, partial [Anaerosporobacter sp.]|uniref:Ig-like domain-containing protein n=1 Tax=Anaerosporobacter sp. TaxID=1872529 RepID=UPI00286F3E3F
SSNAGNKDTAKTDEKFTIKTVVKDKTATIYITVNEKAFESELKTATVANPMNLKIELPLETILKQLREQLNNKVNVIVTLPNSFVNNKKIKCNDLVLEKSVLAQAQTYKKSITVSIKNAEDKLVYQWSIASKDLAKATKNSAIYLNVAVNTVKDNADIKKLIAKDTKNTDGIVITYTQKNKLTVQASTKIYVGEQAGIKAGKKVYVYRYNELTNKLETLKGGYGYVVDKDGYITLNMISGGRYVILAKEASSKVITSLLNQITVTKSVSLNVGKTSTIKVILPNCLEKVSTLKTATQFPCIGAVTVTYTSSNKNVATVGKTTGKITAKKKGKTTITATVTLYSGKVKTFKTSVVVK